MPAPELIDTHCHLNFRSYDDDREAVLQRAAAAGVSRIVVPAIDLLSCHEVLELAERYEGVQAAVGIHPNSSYDFSQTAIESLRALASHRNVLAIGEIGLDYYWDKSPKPVQKMALQRQLDLASNLELPVIIHNRDASGDIMAILEAWASRAPARLNGRLGVLHSFSASYETAARALELGFYIGFTGPLTFKNANALRQLAGRIPPERLLIETDGPFLAPQQQRGKRNEPAYVRYINEQLAQLHGVAEADMARQTKGNAERLFALA